MSEFTLAHWVTLLVGMAIATQLSRLLPILLLGKRRLPPWVQSALGFVPSAVLAAAIAPALAMPAGQLDLSFTNYFLLAAGPTFFVALLTTNMLVVVTVGMATISLLRL